MGHRQSQIQKNKLSDTPPKTQPHNAFTNSVQQEISTEASSTVHKTPKLGTDNGSIPKSPTTSGTSKKYELRAAHVNTLVAKTWNPNDPKSWEPEMREYHELADSDYMLPSDAKEQDRLEMQNYIFKAAFQGDIICPTVKELVKTPGYKILDVGCAKGFWLKQVKKDNPLAECHGVDISKTLVEQSSEDTSGVFLQFGNVLDTLPYEDNTFDYVHQRLLVLGMPRDKFPNALRELIRVTKPGGWIELIEADVVIYNAGPYSQTFTTALFDGLHRRGLDCYAATNLPWHVKQVAANVENQEHKMVHISIGWGSKIGILAGADARIGFLGMEDWLHHAMSLSREEYRELVQGCYSEWPEYKSFTQDRVLYFQVKK